MKRVGLNVLVIMMVIWGISVVQSQDTLSETYTSSDGLANFYYPESWVVREDYPTITLATHPNVLPIGSPLGRDQLRATVMIAPQIALNAIEADTSLNGIMGTIIPEAPVSTCQAFTTPENLMHADVTLLRSTQTCNTAENVLIIRELENGAVGIISASTLLDEMNDFTPTLLDIAVSMMYGELESPVPSQVQDGIVSFVASDDAMTFEHPAMWQVAYDAPSNTATLSLPDDTQFTLSFFTNSTIDEVVDIIQVEQFDDQLKIDTMTEIEHAGYEGFRIDVEDNNDTIVMVDYLLDVGNTVIVHVNFNPPPENLADIETSILDLMTSMQTTLRSSSPTSPLMIPNGDDDDEDDEGSDI